MRAYDSESESGGWQTGAGKSVVYRELVAGMIAAEQAEGAPSVRITRGLAGHLPVPTTTVPPEPAPGPLVMWGYTEVTVIGDPRGTEPAPLGTEVFGPGDQVRTWMTRTPVDWQTAAARAAVASWSTNGWHRRAWITPTDPDDTRRWVWVQGFPASVQACAAWTEAAATD
ncbi:hypothetical protein SAMN05421803_14917 [Nocardiopsis flavescens]|uniref:Uncharacterized protein n=2 Tax=Nocardiopsis flavescens TaxID=758803 RepID=A0A1M6WS56_9ACTN|nr:hypothetical protein SAMN05421803_14917 [Nocardiopsis flavescens]